MGVGSQCQAPAALPQERDLVTLHRRLGPYDILGYSKYL